MYFSVLIYRFGSGIIKICMNSLFDPFNIGFYIIIYLRMEADRVQLYK
jgi:hypothetical protein